MRWQFGLYVLAGALAVPGYGQGIGVEVNGQAVSFTGARPLQVEGRVMVPLRGVLSQMGATVVWDPSTRTVLGTKGDRQFELPIGSRRAIVNGHVTLLDVPAQVLQGSTMVPLRFVSEALGADVRWDGAARLVRIDTQGTVASEPSTEPAPPPGGTAVTPGAGTPTPTGAAPEIESFTHTGQGTVRAGSTVQAILEGTPGAKATFDVLGLATSVPMQEVQPGRYVGQVKVPAGVAVRNARVVGRLAKGGQQSPIVQAGTPITIDAQPPQILNVSPASGSVVSTARPDIYAQFVAEGPSSVNPASVRVLVNGRDVTSQARVTPTFVHYQPAQDLSTPTTVSITVADQAGNTQTASTTFQVRPQATGLTSVTLDADQPLRPGDVLTVTAKGSPGGTALFDIPNIVQGVRMAEQSPGVYTGTYTVRSRDKAIGVPVTVRFVSSSGQASRMAAAQRVSLAGGEMAKPQILRPESGTKLSGSVIVAGRAEPNSTVRVTLSSTGTVLGLLSVEGTEVVQQVEALPSGIFSTPAMQLPAPTGARNVRYRVEVVATDPLGRTSEPVVATYSGTR